MGIVAHRFCAGLTSRALPFLPPISALTITLVVAGIIAINARSIIEASADIFLVVICHNILGMAFGYAAGRMFLVTGKEKHDVLSRALNLLAEPTLPAQKVRPGFGELIWVVDEAAARGE